MAIYLGNAGYVTITRSAGDELRGTLNPSDVDVGARRFGLDIPSGSLITGDRINIRRIEDDGSLSTKPLGLTASSSPDGSWFVHVDPLDGLRLFTDWADSLTGSGAKAVALQAPPDSFPVLITMDEDKHTCVAQGGGTYNLSTSRDTVDVTSLGDAFRNYDSGLISGTGRLTCIWDWRQSSCGNVQGQEVAQYFHQLILRQQLGSEFRGNFYIKRRGVDPSNETLPRAARETGLYYDAECIVTGVGMDFTAGDILQSSIDFILTGEIQMRYDTPDAYLILQESGDKIELEDDTGYLARGVVAIASPID